MTAVLLNILSVVFELLIYYFFFQYFFKKAHFSKKKMVVIYLLIGIVSLYLSICVSDKSLHRLGYYGIIILLALCYE